MVSSATHYVFPTVPAHTGGGLLPRGTRVEIFEQIFTVFLLLGTLVGVIVIAYMVFNAYKYRWRDGVETADESDRPTVGELPTGSGGGRKLFVSLGISAVIVISLIAWTYLMLLYVEQGAAQPDDVPGAEEGAMTIEVVGSQFTWEFTYPNGHTSDELVVPRGRTVALEVTSADVFHTFGIPELRAKADAIPGRTTDTWFRAEQTGEYRALCYELCGSGHSYMAANVTVVEPSAFQEWYANTSNGNDSSNGTDNASNGADQ